MNVPQKVMITNNRVYDILKYTAQIFLPALGALYFGLSQIWGFGYGAEVVGTIATVNTFLGVLLGINSAAYNDSDAKYDGAIVIQEGEDVDTFSLNYDGDPYDILSKKEVIFRVSSGPTEGLAS